MTGLTAARIIAKCKALWSIWRRDPNRRRTVVEKMRNHFKRKRKGYETVDPAPPLVHEPTFVPAPVVALEPKPEPEVVLPLTRESTVVSTAEGLKVVETVEPEPQVVLTALPLSSSSSEVKSRIVEPQVVPVVESEPEIVAVVESEPEVIPDVEPELEVIMTVEPDTYIITTEDPNTKVVPPADGGPTGISSVDGEKTSNLEKMMMHADVLV
jgi:hypothetical protein